MKNTTIAFKKLANDKKLTSYDIVCNAILRAINCKKNVPTEEIATGILSRAFTEVTNNNKLNNGHWSYRSIRAALNRINNLYWNKSQWATRGKILGLEVDEVFENEEQLEHFKRISTRIDFSKLNKKYVVIFVAQQMLTPEQQLVQASHAAFKLGNQIEFERESPNFWVIGVPVDTLDELFFYLKDSNQRFVEFREPDVGNLITAIALHPMRYGNSHRYKTDNLLRF